MQKARRHNQRLLRPLVGRRFQGLFHPLFEVFSPFLHSTGSLSVSREYLALRDGPRWFTQNFCSALLRIPLGFIKESYTGLSPSTAVFSKTFLLLNRLPWRGPTTPILPKQHRFGLFRLPATTCGITFVSSLPWVLRCFSSPRSLSLRNDWPSPAGLPHSESWDQGYFAPTQLIAAYHVLHRPPRARHPPSALAYFLYH